MSRPTPRIRPSRSAATLLIIWVVAACGGGASFSTGAPTATDPGADLTTTATTSATATPTARATPAPSLVMTDASLKVGSVTRTYRLVEPPTPVASLAPLLVFLHGATMTNAGAERVSGLDELAASEGAFVVYPQGHGNTWNAGACCAPATDDEVDDVAFLSALIDHLVHAYPIDPDRILIGGGSNGGEMAYRFACEHPERVAAVVDVVGTLLVDCQPSQPVSVLDIHGTVDDFIPYDGGPGCEKAACPAVPDVRLTWKQLDGCSGAPVVTASSSLVYTSYGSCAAGTQVTFILAIGRRHEWYRDNPNDLEEIWTFFTEATAAGQ